MYESFFGLTKFPFSTTADPDFLLLTGQHREALAGLSYSIATRRGITILTGDVGTGKTTLVRRALRYFPENKICTSVVSNPVLSPPEFLEAVLDGFGLEPVPPSKTRRLGRLEAYFSVLLETGHTPALIVDEAHALTFELLEEIRLLGNLEHGDTKLLSILLCGQTELDAKLDCQELRQLRQRIAHRFTIGPLRQSEVAPYVEHRWSKGGGTLPSPFTEEAVRAVANASRGLPRLINTVCDNALLAAFSEQSKSITAKHVETAACDLKLAPAAPQPAAALDPEPEPAATALPVAAAGRAGQATMTPLRTLSNYHVANESFWTRWAGRLGLAN